MQEARLAREAEICYATLVLVTDYDCWHESDAAVDIGEILRVMRLNVEHGAARRGDPGAADRRRARATARCGERAQACDHHRPRGDPAQGAAPTCAPIIGKYVPGADAKRMSIVVVGSVAFDTIETQQGRADDVLGGVATLFRGRGEFLRAGAVWSAWSATTFPPRICACSPSAASTCAGSRIATASRCAGTGRYHEDMNKRDTLGFALNVFADFAPELPARPATRRLRLPRQHRTRAAEQRALAGAEPRSSSPPTP